MPPSVAISAVIPVHNEAGFIEHALPTLLEELERVGRSFEVIVAENGSTDGTPEIGRSLAANDDRVRLISLPDPNYGAAMRAGFLDAAGEWVVNFDIDYFSGAFVEQALTIDADIVLASKRVPGAEDRRSRWRRLGTWGFNLLLRGMFGSEVSDTHGMKAIRGPVVATIVPQVGSTLDLFDTELVLRAERAGYEIAEIPVVVEEMRSARSSFVGRIPRTVRGMWRIRRQLAMEARSSETS